MVLAQLCAPAEDLDAVAAQLRTADVVIHTTFAGREVLAHREGTGDGTVLHHILLDSFRGAQAVRRAGLLLVVTQHVENEEVEHHELGHAEYPADGVT